MSREKLGMVNRFDPHIPPTGPSDAAVHGEFTRIAAIADRPSLGPSNLVVDRSRPFDIEVSWRLSGNLVPLWLTALSVRTENWVVTAFAESPGPGSEITLGSVEVPVGGPYFSVDESFTARLTVPAHTLPAQDPDDPSGSGVYKIVVTAFLDSDLGPVGYDMTGYAEGPIIKVEDGVSETDSEPPDRPGPL
jgi:hypothetical protein